MLNDYRTKSVKETTLGQENTVRFSSEKTSIKEESNRFGMALREYRQAMSIIKYDW